MARGLARMKMEDRLVGLVVTVILLVVLLSTLYPFWHVLVVSLNDPLDTIRGGLGFWPRKLSIATYERLLQNPQIYRAALMSVIRTAVGVGLSTIGTVLAAYALSRREFVLRRFITVMLVVTMYVHGGLIPQYFLYRSLGLLNNFWVYILPHLATAFNVIIVRTYIRSQPDSFIESARIDGAGEFTIIFRIVMPLIIPVIAVVILFIAVFHWNSWFDTYIFASRNDSLSTLQFELQKRLTSAMALMEQGRLSSGQAVAQMQDTSRMTTPEAVRAAMTMITTVPIILVYPFLQRYFVAGLVIGGLKD